MKAYSIPVYSGGIYFVGQAEEMESDVWANRPGVVISSDTYNENSDDVYVVFLSKKAIGPESSKLVKWYRAFSPEQVNVQCRNELLAALCSCAARVPKACLSRWMDEVSSDKLQSILSKVCMDKDASKFFWLATSEDDGLQAG